MLDLVGPLALRMDFAGFGWPIVPAPLDEPDEQLDTEMYEPGSAPLAGRPGTPKRALAPSSNAAAREPAELLDASA